jgi:hypothetical protein
MRHTLARQRFTWTLVLLAWLAQLCMPVAHAAMTTSSSGSMAAWCGDPANASEAAAVLPAEIRNALDLDAHSADHRANCAKLCAVGSTPVPLPSVSRADLPQASGTTRAPTRQPTVATRRHALPPPSHGPPPRA